MDLSPGLRVVVPVATASQELHGMPPLFTSATVESPAPDRGKDMWWLQIDLATGGTIPQLYGTAEVVGLWAGPGL